MCGISGFCDFSKNFKKEPVLWERILTDMHHALAHRGSDSFGTYLDTHVGLSHARLSIRDIAGGSQPMIRQDEVVSNHGNVYLPKQFLQESETAQKAVELFLANPAVVDITQPLERVKHSLGLNLSKRQSEGVEMVFRHNLSHG